MLQNSKLFLVSPYLCESMSICSNKWGEGIRAFPHKFHYGNCYCSYIWICSWKYLIGQPDLNIDLGLEMKPTLRGCGP